MRIVEAGRQPASMGSLRWIRRRIGIGLAVVTVLLVLLGQGIFLVRTIGDSPGQTAPSVALKGTLLQRLEAIASSALGDSDRKAHRFAIRDLKPESSHSGYKAVTVQWAINNDVMAGSVGNGAQVDAYAVFRGIFTAHLPIDKVTLLGTYPVTSNRSAETIVMRLWMDRRTAQTIGPYGWNNVDPESLWALVHRQYVAPDFQPISGGM
jgi:hypothetical protein